MWRQNRPGQGQGWKGTAGAQSFPLTRRRRIRIVFASISFCRACQHSPCKVVRADGARLSYSSQVFYVQNLGVSLRVLPHKLLHTVVPARCGGTRVKRQERRTGCASGHGCSLLLHGWIWRTALLVARTDCAGQSAASIPAMALSSGCQHAPLAGSLADQSSAGLIGSRTHGGHHRVQATVLAGSHSGSPGPASGGRKCQAEG